MNGKPVYQGTDVENFIAYQGNGTWILFINDDPIYSGGSAAGPATTNGAWASFIGDTPPTVTAN